MSRKVLRCRLVPPLPHLQTPERSDDPVGRRRRVETPTSARDLFSHARTHLHQRATHICVHLNPRELKRGPMKESPVSTFAFLFVLCRRLILSAAVALPRNCSHYSYLCRFSTTRAFVRWYEVKIIVCFSFSSLILSRVQYIFCGLHILIKACVR